MLSGRREAKGRENAQRIIDAGGEAILVTMDVSEQDQVKRMVQTAMETYKRIDILVNNAGILVNKTFENSTVDDWNRLMSVDGLGYCLTMWEIFADHDQAEKRVHYQCQQQIGSASVRIQSLLLLRKGPAPIT